MIAAALRAATKRFGSIAALDRVELEIAEGEVLALLGPNGAGKSTAVSLLIGLRRPDSGHAELFGQDPTQPAARAGIGITPQEHGFPPTLRVREIIDLVRAHFAHPAARADLLERFGLADVAGRQAGGLSGESGAGSPSPSPSRATLAPSSSTSRPPASTSRPVSRCGTK